MTQRTDAPRCPRCGKPLRAVRYRYEGGRDCCSNPCAADDARAHGAAVAAFESKPIEAVREQTASPQTSETRMVEVSIEVYVPDWARWIAMNRAGEWWAYETEPHPVKDGTWISSSGGAHYICRLDAVAKLPSLGYDMWEISKKPIRHIA